MYPRRNRVLATLLAAAVLGSCAPDPERPDARDAEPTDVVANDVLDNDRGGDAVEDARSDAPDAADAPADMRELDVAEDAAPFDVDDAREDAAELSDLAPDVPDHDAADSEGDRPDSTDAPDVDADPPCPVCDDGQICLAGVCAGLGGSPCGDAVPCVPDHVCGVAGICAQAVASTIPSLTWLGSPLASWPEPWTFDIGFRDRIGFGASAAFAERDDRSLELVVAAASDHSENLCRYTVVGDTWLPDDAVCAAGGPNVHTVAWLPPHAGLPSRFVLGGNNRVVVTGDSLLDAVSMFDDSDPAADRLCAAFAIYPIDIDLDGLLDAVVGCHGSSATIGTERQILIFRGLRDGGWERMRAIDADELRRPLLLLALATFDTNDDGLLDLLFVADTFSNPVRRNTLNHPSFVLRRCSPLESCVWTPEALDDGLDRWASHMGVGRLRVDTVGTVHAISDWGPRDLRDLSALPSRDWAIDALFAGGSDPESGEYLYSWSMAVADFDRNGLQDLFVTQASAEVRRLATDATVPAHPDLLLLQQGGGRFVEIAEGAWLVDDAGAYPPGADSARHRGAIVQDFDLDGLLDVFVNQYGRPPLRLEEPDAGLPRRCTLRFAPTVIPSVGHGVEVGPTPGGPWDALQLQGEMRLQAPMRGVVDAREGFVRFPSGAVVPYECGASSGPIDVTEPNWLEVTRDGDVLRVEIDSSAWPAPITGVDIALVDADRVLLELVPLTDGMVASESLALSSDAMVRINGRWVGRYFPTAAPPESGL